MFGTHMSFGKFCGRPLSKVPLSYLEWVLCTCESIDLQLRTEIRRVVEEGPAGRLRRAGRKAADFGIADSVGSSGFALV
jgi:hypothetical protein